MKTKDIKKGDIIKITPSNTIFAKLYRKIYNTLPLSFIAYVNDIYNNEIHFSNISLFKDKKITYLPSAKITFFGKQYGINISKLTEHEYKLYSMSHKKPMTELYDRFE